MTGLRPFVCFACRKSFKRPRGLAAPPCPDCGLATVGLGEKFQPPRKDDAKAWSVVRFVVDHGFRYASIDEEDRFGRLVRVPHAYPTTMDAAHTFVARYAAHRIDEPDDAPRTFGERLAGGDYVVRPGSYAVLLGDRGRVAVVRTKRGGYHLPGGGAEPGESAEATLRREVREECGFDVEIVAPLGSATQFVNTRGKPAYEKQCTFFRARREGTRQGPGEADHALAWLDPDVARERLDFGSHAWAVARST